MCPDLAMTYRHGFFICAFLLCLTDGGLGQQRRGGGGSSSGSGASASQVVDFDCPEEFGYYPHPGDCTQYYVCVFGGALLESCTGGLMYSHELQTCDWPRNVGCGSGGAPEVQVVSTAKTQEPPPRQRSQQQISRQQQQQQQQQYVPQRPLQREEAIPKHHLYAEEELGPAEEVESDRQQRVYRGQPATLGQVARDRDGLSRHSNAIQITPSNGREKLSVISFGTQQQYSRQSIAPPPYVEPTTTTRVTGRGYNATQQQQYTPSPYDPYYNIYEDDSDLYKDIDYSQYQGQQYQSQPKPPVQQQVQAPPAPSPSRKPTLQYTPSPPPPQSYNAVQQDVYNQAQDYSDNYNLQDEDIDYKQADIDVKGNRSRTAKRQDPAKSAVGKGSEKQDQTNVSPNRRLTLTASFSFDNDKTPVTSSRKFETNPRQRSNVNSFQVEDPLSSGPERDTHELVLSYIRQENSAVKTESKETKPNTYALNTETLQIEPSFKDNPNRYTYYLDDLETSEISTTAFPKKSDSSSNELRTVRPFRIVVPSSTEKPSDSATTEETSSRPRFTMRRGNKHFEDTSEHSTTTNSIDGTVKPYKLPPLSRETIEMSLQKSRLKALQTLERKSEEKENEETRRRINQVYNKQAEKSSDENPSESSKNDGSGHLRNNKINYSQELPNVQLPERHSHATRNKYETNEKTTEESSANEQTPLTVDSSPSTGRRYSNRLITTPYIEESDVKLIEIKPVSRRFQNEEKLSEDDTYNKNTLKDLFSTPVSILQHSYQVTEENLDLEKSTPSYVPLSRRFQPKKPASEVKESVNSSFTKESVPLVNLQANGELSKSPLIRSQSTEKSAQKSLYSLRFDNNGGNLKGNVDGHVLATLEAITVSPENPDKTVRTLANTSESQFKNEKDIKHESDRLSDHNNFARSNQIRMRSQSRIYSQQNNQNSRDYQFIPNESTSTESSDKDTAFVPVRSQGGYRTSASTESPITIETPQTNHVNEENVSVSVRSQSHHRTPITTESSNKNEAPQTRYDNDKNSFVPVRTQSLYRTSTSSESPNGNETPQISYDNDRNAFVQVRTQSYFRTPGSSESQIKIETHQASYDDVKNAFVPVRTQSHYRTPTTTESQIRNTTPQATEQKRVTEETPKIENRNTLSYPSTNFEDFEINQNRNQPGRRLRYRNRLETETKDEKNDPENSDRSVSDEGSEYSIQRKSENRVKLGEEGGNEKPNSSPNYDDFQFTPARQFFKTTSSNNNDYVTTDEGSEDIQEAIKRRQNMRRMQIRKKIRITTEQPETSSTDLTETTPTTIRSVRFQYLSQVKYSKKSPAESEVLGEDIGKLNQPEAVSRDQSDFNSSYKKETNSNSHSNRELNQNTHERGRVHFEPKESSLLKSNDVPLVVDPYTLISTSLSSERALNRTTLYQQTTTTPRNNLRVNRLEIKSSSLTEPQLAAELNTYFRKEVQNFTNSSSVESTTPYSMTTVEKIRDKFRLGSFPKPLPSSNSYGRKPSVEDNTPPPLLSDKCSQELDSDPECGEKPLIRVRPTSTSSESQSTPGLTRGSSRNRGSATYTVSPNEAEPPPRGTPSSLSRNRPTLKPSTSIVSKASEFVDIYRYPPSRPEPIYPTPQVDKTAAKCRKDVCLLPDCSCGGKEIPGDLPVEETPQIVLLTFDDSVNDLNKGLYSDLFEKGRTNPNGCPISATFYVSHEWTDYSQVQNLYASGHEIASHSVSHSFGEQFSVKKWTKEIAGQREILSAYGGVRQEDIRGMRAPFLAIGGNKMFKMLYDSNFTYDSSMPVYENRPPSWPYTLDYKIFHDCMIPPCPTRSYPGVWEVPMVMWQDLNGGRCSMGDACSNPPTADGVYKMLVKNFERHFTSNRSPFGLFYHAAWFTQPHHKEGFIAFLDTITKMPEVWLVTNWQAIQWVRDPTPISRLNSFAPFGCNYPERPRKCMNPKVCNLWHKSGVRYMRTCQPCPDIYPWTGKTGVRNSRVDNEIITE